MLTKTHLGLLSSLFLVGCQPSVTTPVPVAVPVAVAPAPAPTAVAMPVAVPVPVAPPTLVSFKPVDVTVVQHESAVIPGFNPALKIQLRDITEGQVLISIKDEKLTEVLGQRSVKLGEVLKFEVGAQTYYLEVMQLKNVAIGDDFGVFRITTTPPPVVKSGS